LSINLAEEFTNLIKLLQQQPAQPFSINRLW
jgi:hypothetical protein